MFGGEPRRLSAGGGHTLDEDDPRFPAEDTPPRLRARPPRLLTYGHALGVPTGVLGGRGSLASHWRRERQRIAMQQRYGEDSALGEDDDEIELLRPEG